MPHMHWWGQHRVQPRQILESIKEVPGPCRVNGFNWTNLDKDYFRLLENGQNEPGNLHSWSKNDHNQPKNYLIWPEMTTNDQGKFKVSEKTSNDQKWPGLTQMTKIDLFSEGLGPMLNHKVFGPSCHISSLWEDIFFLL